MAKKTVAKNLVTPNPKEVKVGIRFEDLNKGDYFIMDGKLWQRMEEGYLDQAGINSITGDISSDLCDEVVIPVVVTITWETK